MRSILLFNTALAYSIFTIALLLSSCGKKVELLSSSSTDYCAKNQQADTIKMSEVLNPMLDLMKDQTGVYVLEDGGTSLAARAWFTSHAVRSIDIQYFIFSTDNIGLIGCDYLVRAADRGVKVRILIDDIMVNAELDDILRIDAHENINIKVYNPGTNLGKSILNKVTKLATDFRSANQRMHNKTFIVDDQIVITGGRNIADEYFDYDHDYNFRDRDVLMLGKESKKVGASFDTFWNNELSVDCESLSDQTIDTTVSYELLHQYACNPENYWPKVRASVKAFPTMLKHLYDSNQIVWLDSIEFISDDPGKNDGKQGLAGGGISTKALIELIQSAQYSIDIQTPYLITTDLGKGLFKSAVERGVKIRILTNSLASTDNVEAFSSYQTDREELLKTGLRIFECKPDAAIRKQLMSGALQKKMDFTPIFGLHAKSMVVDGKTTVIGTFNLDPRSANLNTECIVVMKDEIIASGVLEGMEAEYQPENAWETTLTFNPDKEVSRSKRVKTWTRKILPKAIL
ncbi:MAG: phospholipase D family protein [Reichenbachiella sp.]|uniref:phospholipase D family protein n=1 Tax=Reichenbachiella sp. TaxID=2184521 RepID=UPI003298407C